MKQVKILGIKIDKINLAQAIDKVESWINKSGEIGDRKSPSKAKYLVTPNIEFIMAAQKDHKFREILNNADLAIPDSSRLGWAIDQAREKNLFLKILNWPLFLFPQMLSFDIVTGTDLMEQLIDLSSEKGFTVGFLGGRENVAVKLERVLKEKYPKLYITFVDSGGEINYNGQSLVSARQSNSPPPAGGPARSASRTSMLVPFGTTRLAQTETALRSGFTPSLNIPPTDILFVAFGHIKQEKWIAKNIKNYPVKVMIGVGGAFDYLSGKVLRAPVWVRKLGFEWLFRFFIQPWRIKRFGSLLKFLLKTR